MKILKTSASVQKLALKSARRIRLSDSSTMGYLTRGIFVNQNARKKADVVFVSIFLNPIQFGPAEDFTRYPRDFKRDEKLCKDVGVDFIFYPDEKDIYPEIIHICRSRKRYRHPRRKNKTCHFKGVTTVCLKLFNITCPHFAVFGQKDAQQLAVIRKCS